MAAYVVVSPDAPYPRGTYLIDSDDGYVQEAVLTDEGFEVKGGSFMMPFLQIRDKTIRVQSQGLDYGRGGRMG